MRYGTAAMSASRNPEAASMSARSSSCTKARLGRAVDGHEQVELALCGAYLGEVHMEKADWTAMELGYRAGLSHSTSVRRLMPWRSRQRCSEDRTQLRDGGLKRTEAVVQRQQRVLAESRDNGLLLG